MEAQVEELYSLTRQLFAQKDAGLLPQIDSLEAGIDASRKRLIESHIQRLDQGKCRPDCSGVFINLVSNLERLGDHLTYMAYTTLGKSEAAQ